MNESNRFDSLGQLSKAFRSQFSRGAASSAPSMAITSKRQGLLAQRDSRCRKYCAANINFLRLRASMLPAAPATPLGVFSITNFDEYYCIAVEHDQIKLAAFT